MNYWVIKGRGNWNDWDAMLRPGRTGDWVTARPPRDWSAGDRIFFWESTPKRQVIAIGEIADPDRGIDDEGRRVYAVRYLSRRLPSPLSIGELRSQPGLENATFLKVGPAASVFRVPPGQSEILLSMLAARNPVVASAWGSPRSALATAAVPDVDLTAEEGEPRLASHFVRERDPALVARKREQALRQTGHLACEACDFDFRQKYGSIGADYCEVHHKQPLAQSASGQTTTLDDLAILCSNCHRVLHRTNPLWTVERLRAHIAHQRSLTKRCS